MRKKALLAAMMAMVLLLSGCALIVKDEAVDNATEIIRLGDQVITKGEIKAQTQAALNMYVSDPTNPEAIAEVQGWIVDSYKENLALTAKAKELGLDQLTDEELETVKTQAQDSYDSILESAKKLVKDAEGMDEAALAEAAAKEAEEQGYTLDSRIEYYTQLLVDNKLKDYAVKDVTVTDEEIQAEYDSKVESNKTTYAENAGSWATAANRGTTLYYTPAGVRRVKQILVKFTEEDQKAISEAEQKQTDATNARTAAQAKIDSANTTLAEKELTDEAKAQAEADLKAANEELAAADKALEEATQAVTEATDKAFADIDEKTDEILASLDAEGADWKAIMDEKNEDPGMKDNEKGYAVAEGMTNFDPAFVEAAMALAKPGDHSGKVKSTIGNGYHIIRYESDEAEGPVALDAVKETISSSLLDSKKTEAYNAATAQWVEEAGIKVDLNALK